MPWVNARTKRDIPYQESIYTFLYVFGVATIILFACYKLYSNFKSFCLNRTMWLVANYVIMYIGLCGTVYNILNAAPWAG